MALAHEPVRPDSCCIEQSCHDEVEVDNERRPDRSSVFEIGQGSKSHGCEYGEDSGRQRDMSLGHGIGGGQDQDGDLEGDEGGNSALFMVRQIPDRGEHVTKATYQFEDVKGILPDPEPPSEQVQRPKWGDEDEADSGQDGQDSLFEVD